ncbi:hypothetical protein HPB52_014291 [Rhipicephalus sanguineus]|uniref:Fibronectin type-III domain-containing protein n=1 Tax=Rhipicephalus sanguineus TaxID=34632 RepID=A0A9D4Q6Y0_RHISA|nr:hypothetical protein HPB52_014291 [Rhipicephalus sanguineus]
MSPLSSFRSTANVSSAAVSRLKTGSIPHLLASYREFAPFIPQDEGESPSGGLWLVMENEKPPPYVQYLPGDGTGKPSSSAEPLTKLDLPDVRNLVLLSSTDNSITVTWERPEVRFDYYWVSISADSREKNTTMKQHYMGSCSNGTIIHASQNRVTCTNVDACTNVKFTVRTHINGPPERTSEGATIGGIFIAGKDPDAPRNITAIGISPTLTRVQWAPPSNLTETQTVYAVRVCPNFTSCDGELYGCKENQTSHTWLDFESTVDTTHCVVVVANAQCGPRMLRSPKAMSVVRTPSFAPPDVTNLTIINVGAEFFTVGWTRPEAAFDYYSVELKSPEIQKLSSIGSCANGAIIHRDRTELTCTELEPWIIYELRLHTHITGPPARTSSGRTAVIVTNKKVAPEVSNLKVENIRGTSFVVTWERPKESIEYYTVEVTDHGSGHIGDRFHSIVSCNNGAAINPRQTSLTCTKSDTCTSVSVRVKTHTRGPTEIESPGVTLENVLLPGTVSGFMGDCGHSLVGDEAGNGVLGSAGRVQAGLSGRGEPGLGD